MDELDNIAYTYYVAIANRTSTDQVEIKRILNKMASSLREEYPTETWDYYHRAKALWDLYWADLGKKEY